MTEEDITQELTEKKKNSFIKEIDQNELLSNKNKKVSMTLNYTGHFLILVLQLLYVFPFLHLLL